MRKRTHISIQQSIRLRMICESKKMIWMDFNGNLAYLHAGDIVSGCIFYLGSYWICLKKNWICPKLFASKNWRFWFQKKKKFNFRIESGLSECPIYMEFAIFLVICTKNEFLLVKTRKKKNFRRACGAANIVFRTWKSKLALSLNQKLRYMPTKRKKHMHSKLLKNQKVQILKTKVKKNVI